MKLSKKVANLKKIEKIFNVPKFIYFNYSQYIKDKNLYLEKIKINFKNKIIIRSASINEDNQLSNAGKYLSIGNLDVSDKNKILISIIKVFKSYKNISSNNYVIIQEYISNADTVGVIFSANIKNGSPFRTINFNKTGETDLITSGKINGKSLYYYKNEKKILKKRGYLKIENIILQIEKVFGKNFLDIEFLIKEKKIYLLQVRTLNIKKIVKVNYSKVLKDLRKKIIKMNNEQTALYGNNRYFSTMTDWNPAEIIGLKPNELSLSMYKSLITNNIWSESRRELGYKNISRNPLLHSFLGTPYVDLKADFNSFLLNEISVNIQKKLVNFYLNEFKKKPHYYHDKVESKLVINCISLNPLKYKKILAKSNLSSIEIKDVIQKYTNLTKKIIKKLDQNILLYKEGEKLFAKTKNSKNPFINKIFQLHSLCKSHGTLPFANLARMAFISIEFLESFVEKKIINLQQKELFLENIKSISYDMTMALNKDKKKFLKEFGHLRPNSYDITSLNYKDNFKNYFKVSKENSKKIERKSEFKFTKYQKKEIKKLMMSCGFDNLNVEELITFIKKSISERESSKLFFTKIINEIFLLLEKFANKIGLNKNELKHLDINTILEFYGKFEHKDLIQYLKKNISINSENYLFNQNFDLPNIILNSDDIYLYEEENASPTFISDKTVSAKIKVINKISKNINLDNHIICIKNADPGYDFIFNYNIKGLITAFGGPNSHMSIRCNEFRIPAVLGIGEKKFQYLSKKKAVTINSTKKILSIIR